MLTQMHRGRGEYFEHKSHESHEPTVTDQREVIFHELMFEETKTSKTPLMMATSEALSYWSAAIVPESKLSQMATAHYGFVPKLSHHRGENTVSFHSTEKPSF